MSTSRHSTGQPLLPQIYRFYIELRLVQFLIHFNIYQVLAGACLPAAFGDSLVLSLHCRCLSRQYFVAGRCKQAFVVVSRACSVVTALVELLGRDLDVSRHVCEVAIACTLSLKGF